MNIIPPLADTFDDSVAAFLRYLVAENRSPATLTAYRADLTQFIHWLTENTLVTAPSAVSRVDIAEFLADLGSAELSGQSRGRKLAALRSYFAFLIDRGLVPASPAAQVPKPKAEKRGRTYLSQDGYRQLLALSAGNPRDYAILQTFLQAGVRVSELVSLTVADVDFALGVVHIQGKGLKDRDVPLVKPAVSALKLWLAHRPNVPSNALFLTQYGEPLRVRRVQKLVAHYRQLAGIPKRITPHSLRRTFATEKAKKGVSAFFLRDLMGHENIATTQLYVQLGTHDTRKVMEATSL